MSRCHPSSPPHFCGSLIEYCFVNKSPTILYLVNVRIRCIIIVQNKQILCTAPSLVSTHFLSLFFSYQRSEVSVDSTCVYSSFHSFLYRFLYILHYFELKFNAKKNNTNYLYNRVPQKLNNGKNIYYTFIS